jgi:hypothetical protein
MIRPTTGRRKIEEPEHLVHERFGGGEDLHGGDEEQDEVQDADDGVAHG